MKRKFLSLYLLSLAGICLLSFIYEFFGEDIFHLPFSAITTASLGPESIAERWEYLITVTVFSAISLVAPYLLLARYSARLEKSAQEKIELQVKLDDALTKLLSGFVSICCSCKKVRKTSENNTAGNWEEIDHYIHERTDLKFSHGYCPECAAEIKKLMRSTPKT